MKTPGVCLAGAALAAVLLAGTAANAALQSFSYDITASGFKYLFGPTGEPPIDPVILDFTVKLDPLVTTGPTTAGLLISSFNLPYATGGFTYAPGDVLTVATVPQFGSFGDPADSWGVFIAKPFADPHVFFFAQTGGTGECWYVAHAVVKLVSVPEPAAWAMMLIGLGVVGAMMRARRRCSHAAPRRAAPAKYPRRPWMTMTKRMVRGSRPRA